ncbi:MAG: hydrogenase nickel incorporation protein HypB [Clostridia bacterium]|jgi:hydrogenase nickel incorporation protein HypB|nr:hydrogenase nickel incorporation protein HypB [Clostridia bacterium]
MKIDVMQDVKAVNAAYAEANREKLKNIFTVNIISSPGAGKTTLLEKLVKKLADKVNIAVIEGDLATARDALRVQACGIPAIQINTNGGCHLDAKMIANVLPGFDLAKLDLLIIENVGNLVCPADFDLGEDIKIVLLSVTEGGDKPIKYPIVFLKSSLAIINKIDLLPYCDVDMYALRKDISEINPKIRQMEISCREEKNIDEVAEWFLSQIMLKKQKSIL